MFRISEVVKHLIAINVIIFLILNVFPAFQTYFILSPQANRFMPVQIFTHMFTHLSPQHLFFNMLGLFFFGPEVEGYLGAKKFLVLYFVSGLGAMFCHWMVSPAGLLGASGAIFGVYVAFAYLFGNRKVMLLFPPIPIQAKYMVLIFIGMDLYSGLSGANDGVAHFAHLGGALFGFLLMLYWRKFGS